MHNARPSALRMNGITRQTVIALAKARGIEVQERAIWPSELATFEEAFLTGSAAEITPIREIAGLGFKPGKMTEQLMTEFSALTKRKNAV